MRFEWNARKAAANLRKHGVSFLEASSVFFGPFRRRGQKGSFMRKNKAPAQDELRSEYKRSDFGALVRGKYVGPLQKSSNVVVIDPAVACLFPNAAAVNAALRSLAEIAGRAGSRRGRSH
ncbi:MAG TPA: BrnT family toxin [Bryobacteraceae bacterium]